MFGYIVANKAELKFREFDIYQSYYCGLCKRLKERGGNVSRFALSYDMTFCYMLLSGLYEPRTSVSTCKCILHPFDKRHMHQNECADYVADMSVLMTYYKCRDDWKDDHKLNAAFMMKVLESKNDHLCRLYNEKVNQIANAMEQLDQGESENSCDIDTMAGYFGHIMANILVMNEDEWEPILSRMGFYLGKFIYIMDAYDDIEKDKKKGRYNPLYKLYQTPDFKGECKQILTMMIAECCKEFEKLPILQNVDILRNILYAGVWVRFEIGEKEAEEEQNE
ncbi:MAG TPA: DUF5685 family protein [Lachnospiraceae bacterium]|nr:DUF5685 family protein [Lachnospiraceae bacterium]